MTCWLKYYRLGHYTTLYLIESALQTYLKLVYKSAFDSMMYKSYQQCFLLSIISAYSPFFIYIYTQQSDRFSTWKVKVIGIFFYNCSIYTCMYIHWNMLRILVRITPERWFNPLYSDWPKLLSSFDYSECRRVK